MKIWGKVEREHIRKQNEKRMPRMRNWVEGREYKEEEGEKEGGSE